MALFGGPDPGEGPRLYHYTSAEKLALILTSKRLWLGPYSAMRDPRENGTWRPNLTRRGDTDPPGTDVFELWDQLDAAMRQRAKMVCFTQDRPESGWSPLGADRGWARARMWEQYGDRHRGAILIFDQEKLDAIVTEALPVGLHKGPVHYAAGPWMMQAVGTFELQDIAERGSLAVAEEAIAQHADVLYFEKDIDWASEMEYRYVVINDSHHEEVEALSALLGIIVGMDYPSHELAVLRHRLEQCGLPDLPVSRCMWSNGSPMPVPAFFPAA